MMMGVYAYIFIYFICATLSGITGYFIGKWKDIDKYEAIKDKKLKLIEGIDGVTSVQLTPIRYVELLTKEEEYNELRLKLKDI